MQASTVKHGMDKLIFKLVSMVWPHTSDQLGLNVILLGWALHGRKIAGGLLMFLNPWRKKNTSSDERGGRNLQNFRCRVVDMVAM